MVMATAAVWLQVWVWVWVSGADVDVGVDVGNGEGDDDGDGGCPYGQGWPLTPEGRYSQMYVGRYLRVSR
jgi:hypothetical protein